MPWGEGVTAVDGRRLAGDVADAGVDEGVVIIVAVKELASSTTQVGSGRATSGLFTQTDQAARGTEWEGVKILQKKWVAFLGCFLLFVCLCLAQALISGLYNSLIIKIRFTE